MLDLIDAEKVGVVGHSISGAISLHLAAESPRVAAVLTTGTMGQALRLHRQRDVVGNALQTGKNSY
jgi:2-hydroxymuconate-semialdehyde hydrolase